MENINKKQFEKLLRNFVHHKGKGGVEEHPVVDKWDAGFMSPEMLDKLNQASGEAIFLEDNTDVFQLKAGTYVTWSKDTSISNLPENAGFLVEVSVWNNVKVIKAINFENGREFKSVFDFGGLKKNIPSNWTKTTQEFILYDRPFFGKGTTVELKEEARYFKDLIVIYRHNTEAENTTFIATHNLINFGLTLTTTNITSKKDGIMINEIKVKVDPNNTKMFTITDHVAVNIGKNHLNVTTNLEKVEIIRIVGRLY